MSDPVSGLCEKTLPTPTDMGEGFTPSQAKLIKEIYQRKNVGGWSEGRIAEYYGTDANWVYETLKLYPEVVTQEKQTAAIAKGKVPAGYEVWIPAWNDIIHLVPESSLDEDVRKARLIAKLRTMQNSPTPELVSNLGTIMTAIDDVQDFTTTVGVLARTLGRAFKPAELLSIGAFTVGEFLNRLSLLNKLSGGEKAVICSLVAGLKQSPRGSTIKGDVAKRMKRLFPSVGEALEIAQTTDQLFGVGISLGPIVGFVEDALFGLYKGADWRVAKPRISYEEAAVIKRAADAINAERGGGYAEVPWDSKIWESSATAAANGKDLSLDDYLKSVYAATAASIKARCSKVKDAAINIWDTLTGVPVQPKKRSSLVTLSALASQGIDPFKEEGWPIAGLSKENTIQEIQQAYQVSCQDAFDYWSRKLAGTNEGLFLDACAMEIANTAVVFFSESGGSYSKSLIPEGQVFIRALESGLNPPPETPPEEFINWMKYVLVGMDTLYEDSPPQKLLEEAHRKYFTTA